MVYGICDIPKCGKETYMGWRPLTERIGRQVCKRHWDRHKNKNDRFNLFDTFGFRKPPILLLKAKPEKQPERCACGEVLQPGHRLCKECAAERGRQRKREYYHQKRDDEFIRRLGGSDIEEKILRCKDCGKERLPGRSYCQKCGQRHSRKSNRERQRRYRKKQRSQNCLT